MSSYQLSAPEIKELWRELCSKLQGQVSEGFFGAFILNSPLSKVDFNNDQAICSLSCPSPFHSQSIKKNLESKIIESLEELLGKKVSLNYEIGTPLKKEEKTTASPIYSPRVEDLFSPQNIKSSTLDRAKVAAGNVGLRSDYNFDTFAVSATNEMAHAAAVAVSQKPGSAYNPLFLYGGVGVGKTHLMHAIGNNIISQDPETKIIYCTGEEFTNEIVNAIRTKKAINFKNKYRHAQVFMIDDVQFIAGKDAVQEEFFHTFNALAQINHQIILTSDRPPHEINLLEARLRSRFEAGLIVDIGQPTFELRTAILLIKSAAAHLEIPMNLAQMIASKVDSARKIEGVIKQIKSAIELKNRVLNEELINEILKSENGHESNKKLRVKPQDVIKVVADHFHVKQVAVRGKSRMKDLVRARHVAMYLFCNELGVPLQETGKWFSNRDHTSVLHARDKITKDMALDEQLSQDVDALKMSLVAISK